MEGLELRINRVRLGWSQYILGGKVGLCQSRISEMELDRRPVSEKVVIVVEAALAKLAVEVR